MNIINTSKWVDTDFQKSQSQHQLWARCQLGGYFAAATTAVGLGISSAVNFTGLLSSPPIQSDVLSKQTLSTAQKTLKMDVLKNRGWEQSCVIGYCPIHRIRPLIEDAFNMLDITKVLIPELIVHSNNHNKLAQLLLEYSEEQSGRGVQTALSLLGTYGFTRLSSYFYNVSSRNYKRAEKYKQLNAIHNLNKPKSSLLTWKQYYDYKITSLNTQLSMKTPHSSPHTAEQRKLVQKLSNCKLKAACISKLIEDKTLQINVSGVNPLDLAQLTVDQIAGKFITAPAQPHRRHLPKN